MTNETILQRVHELLDGLSTKNNFVVVLKGVPLSLFGETADLDAAAKNPLNYFFRWTTGGRKFLSHEEFLLTGAFVTAQFDAVYVIDNNSFDALYPIEENFSAATKKILLEHFAELETADEPVTKTFGNVDKLIKIFTEVRDEQ